MGQQYRLDVAIEHVDVGPRADAFQPVELRTNRGDIACRYYPAEQARRAVVWVGGVGGGWDSPAHDLYPHLCTALTGEGLASLRVRFRYPTILDEAAFDVLAGLVFLHGRGVVSAGLVGHSFGGAVVIQAAAHDDMVRTVITLATQSAGAQPAAVLAPRCSLLLLHGTDDRVLSVASSRYVYEIAGQPKELIVYDGAGHSLDRVAGQVEATIRAWLGEHLGGSAEPSG